ncbi:MAG: ribosomal protein S18-alanine N-acetyltransferase [Planctomycetaceae bacterium]|nr:ribosomal protein S18-alanine N-acetyltransferase [Planctomycetaceae bacterium]
MILREADKGCDWLRTPEFIVEVFRMDLHDSDKSHSHDNKEIKVYVRWMVRRDFPEVLAIEQSCFEFPWREEDFIHCLRQRNCIGMVAEYEGRVVGFMIYEVPKNRIHLLNIATSPEFRRRGVAGQMIQKLVSKLANQRRSRIVLEVRETNLPALVFFRALGFRATVVIKNFYEDMNEDAYVLQYRLYNHSDSTFVPSNRISTRIAG